MPPGRGPPAHNALPAPPRRPWAARLNSKFQTPAHIMSFSQTPHTHIAHIAHIAHRSTTKNPIMAKGKQALKPPTAAGGGGRRRQRTAWWQRLLEWAQKNPGASVAAVASVAFVVVVGVWSPLGPEQFAYVRLRRRGEWGVVV